MPLVLEVVWAVVQTTSRDPTGEESMSYTIKAYSVDLPRLRKFYGSDNRDTLNDICEKMSQMITKIDMEISEDWGEDTPGVTNVLETASTGHFPWKYHDAPYKAMLELLCAYFGEELTNEEVEFMSPHGVKFIEEDFTPMGNLVFRSSSPVAIPGIEEETMYRVGHLESNKIPEVLAEVTAFRLNSAVVNQDWERAVCEKFTTWLEIAFSQGRGLVTFFV